MCRHLDRMFAGGRRTNIAACSRTRSGSARGLHSGAWSVPGSKAKVLYQFVHSHPGYLPIHHGDALTGRRIIQLLHDWYLHPEFKTRSGCYWRWVREAAEKRWRLVQVASGVGWRAALPVFARCQSPVISITSHLSVRQYVPTCWRRRDRCGPT